jgi:hypothetical protein
VSAQSSIVGCELTVAPLAGLGVLGVPGIVQLIVKLQVEPGVEPQLFFAATYHVCVLKVSDEYKVN